MSEHSAGPWKACGSHRGICVCGQVWSVGADMPVATVFKQDDDVGELAEATWKANAVLIARAPELLADLAEARALLAESNEPDDRCLDAYDDETDPECQRDNPCWEHRRRAFLERTK